MKDDTFNAIIISETHWDRAWYQTFQQFRLRLVKLVDKLLDILETDPDFSHYTFDGQTVVLEDYLEVKPEEKDRLAKLIRNGRIDIGPWYILPDVFLVSGESLIRNFLRGKRVSKDFGRWMDVGYIPDPFGHVSQMPQILSQFSIDSIIFARGTGEESEELGSEFIWEASDGSEVLAHWLPGSYGNAANLPEDVQDAVYVLEDVIGRMKPWSRIGTYLLMNGSDHLEPQKHLPEVVKRFNETHEDRIIIGTLPMFIERVRQKRGELKRYRGEFRRSKYQNLLSGVYSARVYIKQANDHAQRLLERSVEPWCYISYLLGGRYPLDEIRLAWKYLLLNHPHDDICGCSIDEVHDDNMQRFRWIEEIAVSLLEDSQQEIVKMVESDTHGVAIINPSAQKRSGIAYFEIPASNFRYSRLADIQLHDPTLKPQTPLEAAKNDVHIAYVRKSGFDLPPTSEKEVVIGSEKLYDYEFDFSSLAMLDPPLRRALRHVSTAYRIRVNSKNEIVDVWARKFDASEPAGAVLELDDRIGNRIPLQLLDYEMMKDPGNHLIDDREEYLTFALDVKDIPAVGMKRYDMAFTKKKEKELDGAVIVTEDSIENGLLRIVAQENGTITITDKRTAQIYEGVLMFEDSADAGDSYDYCPIESGSIVYDSLEVAIEEGHAGPLVGSLILSGTLDIPVGLDLNALERLEETAPCEFVTEIILTKDSPTIQVTTVFNNLADDHRLRVLFPTRSDAKSCEADSTFDVVERPIRPVQESEWVQPVAPTYPLRNFASLGHDGRGLTITTKGLLEFEILKENGGTIALTLVRSIGWLSRMGFATRAENAGPIVETPGAQCLGSNTFEFAITPHTGSWLTDRTYLESERYLHPLQCLFIPKGERRTERYEYEGIRLSPECMRISALKQSEDSKLGVLRFWNISDTEEVCTIDFGVATTSVMAGRMDESIDKSIEIQKENERRYKVLVPPRKVITILFEPKR